MKIKTYSYSDKEIEGIWDKTFYGKTYLQLPSFQKYLSLYHHQDYTFFCALIENAEGPLALIPYTLNLTQKKLSYYDHPLDVIWKKNLDQETKDEAYSHLVHYLKKLAEEKEIGQMQLHCDPPMLGAFVSRNYQIENRLQAKIDLLLSEDKIMQNFRKSYRSLINWGKRELRTEIVDHLNPNADLFEQFRLFHIQVAGKETRTKSTWDQQLEMIKNNQAYAVMCFWNEELVAASLILHGRDEAYYGVAVNNRELMAKNKALGHWCVLKSIMLAKEKGLACFNLGDVGPETIFSNPKESAIAKFKLGFSSQVFVTNNLIIEC